MPVNDLRLTPVRCLMKPLPTAILLLAPKKNISIKATSTFVPSSNVDTQSVCSRSTVASRSAIPASRGSGKSENLWASILCGIRPKRARLHETRDAQDYALKNDIDRVAFNLSHSVMPVTISRPTAGSISTLTWRHSPTQSKGGRVSTPCFPRPI
jgi:hypothetical protein